MSVISKLSLCFFVSCSLGSNDLLRSAKKLEKKSPEKALLIYDRAFQKASTSSKKLEILNLIEDHVKNRIKRADLLKGVLDQKLPLIEKPSEKNQILLDLAQLSLQNLKDNDLSLSYLDKVKYGDLLPKQRSSYFKSVVFSYLNGGQLDQAIIEADRFLNFKDLLPSERFNLEILKAKGFVALKQNARAISNYEMLISKYPNLSKTWKVRSQLALLFEEQRDYKKAIANLETLKSESKEEASLLEWRIKELSKRLAQQPGQSGKLKR